MNHQLPRPPKRIFPLYGKILLWFIANILLVGGGAFWLLREQFGLDRTLLLTRDGRARLQLRAQQTVDHLVTSGHDPVRLNELLAQLAEDEKMHFALYHLGGEQIAGEPLELPPLVRERLGNAGGRPRGAPPTGGPPKLQNDGPPGPPFESNPPRPGAEGRRRERGETGDAPMGRARRNDGRPVDFLQEALRTEKPGRYWVLARLPPVSDGSGRGRPLMLIGMAKSLGQSPLLFDPKPWVLAAASALAVSALLWWPFVRGLTRSLAQMRQVTGRVACGDFTVRVDERRNDEIGQLGAAINVMTGRLEGFVHGQKRFLGDIAHELCSPLARMEMALGILEHRSPPDLHDRLSDVREEVREMSTLVNELLAFSKTALQETTATRTAVALGPLVRDVIAREAPASRITLDIPESIHVHAVASLLARAISNILRNAVHHAGINSPIEITASHLPSVEPHPPTPLVLVTINDHGPGVPSHALAKLFDPFYRVDTARARETGGVGLGLAIVKSCIQACGGTVVARHREDGATGLAMEIVLPADPGPS
jgi:two-component system sensor histidine kinase CpxA